jgi:hypothetical protein
MQQKQATLRCIRRHVLAEQRASLLCRCFVLICALELLNLECRPVFGDQKSEWLRSIVGRHRDTAQHLVLLEQRAPSLLQLLHIDAFVGAPQHADLEGAAVRALPAREGILDACAGHEHLAASAENLADVRSRNFGLRSG